MSHEILPVLFQWDETDEVLRPADRHRKLCLRQFTDGGIYFLGPHGGANSPSDKAYFAQINSVWKTLPEDMAERFPTAEHLRKYALIKCGYHRHEMRTFDSAEDAQKAALMIRPFERFAVIRAEGCDVHVFTAMSQRRGSGMSDEDRKESQEKVLNWLAESIGVTRSDLRKHSEAKTGDA